MVRDTPVPLVSLVESEPTKTAQDPVTAIHVEMEKQPETQALQEYHFVVRTIPNATKTSSIELFKI